MACNCKNQDGTLSQICFGTCSNKIFPKIDAVQERSEKSIEDRMEYMLSIFIETVDERIQKLEYLVMDKYKKGYQDGFRDGKEY